MEDFYPLELINEKLVPMTADREPVFYVSVQEKGGMNPDIEEVDWTESLCEMFKSKNVLESRRSLGQSLEAGVDICGSDCVSGVCVPDACAPKLCGCVPGACVPEIADCVSGGCMPEGFQSGVKMA